MKTIISIPLPQSLLSGGNFNGHWTAKHKRNKLIDKWLMTFWPKQEITLPCKITFIRIAPRQIDSHDNLRTTFKHCTDWIANKLIPGLPMGQADSDPRLTWEYKQERGLSKEYLLKIEIEC